MALTQHQLDRREAALRSARGHHQTEGLSGYPDDEAVLDAYGRGEIEEHEVMAMLDANLNARQSHAA